MPKSENDPIPIQQYKNDTEHAISYNRPNDQIELSLLKSSPIEFVVSVFAFNREDEEPDQIRFNLQEIRLLKNFLNSPEAETIINNN